MLRAPIAVVPKMPENQEDIDSLLAEVSALADEAVTDIIGDDGSADPGAVADTTDQANADTQPAATENAEEGALDPSYVPQEAAALEQAGVSTKSPTPAQVEKNAFADLPSSATPSPMGSARVAPTPKPASAPKVEDPSRILKLEVPVIVRLAETLMPVSEIINMSTGAIIEFDKPSESELDLLINNKCIGRGQAVKVGENFGLRITNIGSLRERIKALGNQ